MKKLVTVLSLTFVIFGHAAAARADYSCDCQVKDDDSSSYTVIVDGQTEEEAKQACTEQDGKVLSCMSQGRGDR